MSAKHTPGTVYPINGRPHLPTMCSHRTCVRRNFRSHTALCYEPGTWEFVRPDGLAVSKHTAEGPMPFRFCDKHQKQVAQSYRGSTWRKVVAGIDGEQR